jgi:pimeloyl-ACP methyl ester carboxylesterase
VSRRAFLTTGAATAVAATARSSRASSQLADKATFVLVHPAWLGGWCWRKVVPLLRIRGHDVHAPTLTGLGERAHLIDRRIGLDTHIEDVTNLLVFEDLRRMILVGNSSGGMVITGVAERAPERVAGLVYLDAFVPEHNQSLVDLLPAERRQAMEGLVKSDGDGWLLPRFAALPWERIVRDLWGVTSSDDVSWMLDRLKPTPFRHFTDRLSLTSPTPGSPDRTYIRCRQFRQPVFDRHATMAQQTVGWRYRELATSHLPYVTHPAEVAEVLIDVAT